MQRSESFLRDWTSRGLSKGRGSFGYLVMRKIRESEEEVCTSFRQAMTNHQLKPRLDSQVLLLLVNCLLATALPTPVKQDQTLSLLKPWGQARPGWALVNAAPPEQSENTPASGCLHAKHSPLNPAAALSKLTAEPSTEGTLPNTYGRLTLLINPLMTRIRQHHS